MCHHSMNPLRAALAVVFLAGFVLLAADASAQVLKDPPMIYQEPTEPAPLPEEEPPTEVKILQAISWYLPNRIADLADVPRVYVTFGSGLVATVRGTWL